MSKAIAQRIDESKVIDISTVFKDYSAVIPKQVRKMLRLEHGDKIVWEMTELGIIVKKAVVRSPEEYNEIISRAQSR